MKHPIQPLSKDTHGTLRFKKNAIVAFLLDAGPFDMNQIALMPFAPEDREQFAQLIGYSLSDFSELDYVSSETYSKAATQESAVPYPYDKDSGRCLFCGDTLWGDAPHAEGCTWAALAGQMVFKNDGA